MREGGITAVADEKRRKKGWKRGRGYVAASLRYGSQIEEKHQRLEHVLLLR